MVALKEQEKCRLCGRVEPLTFEHVPPRVAFNDHTVIEKDFMAYMGPKGKDWGAPPDERGRQMQRGNGGRWLCRSCNSFLGREYIPHYAKFVRGLVLGTANEVGVVEVSQVCVKRFFKQVAAMFIAVNAGGPNWPAFARFVREPSEPQPPKGYRFFMFGCRGPMAHLYGFQHQIDGITTGQHRLRTISQVSQPPIGFQLLHDYEGEHDSRMLEITDWAQYGLDVVATVSARLVLLPLFSPMFNDFRTPAEMERNRLTNEARLALRNRGWWLPRE